LQCGEISAEHYANFGKLRQESAHYEMSYAEKRKKDREFGRFIKTAKKDLDD
jgi:ribosome biogenesis GTPase